MRHRIVYTRIADGGVSVCGPAPEIITALGSGGLWAGRPRGFAERQIASMIARGVLPDAARNYARAIVLGGCSTQEALAIIRDRDCAHLGRQIELWDVDDIPSDRWFRDAWSRSHNGGPIVIDLRKARRIQWQRIKAAIAAHNGQRQALGRKPRPVMWGEVGSAIRHARDSDELRRVWPEVLNGA